MSVSMHELTYALTYTNAYTRCVKRNKIVITKKEMNHSFSSK